jgi:hypothetical protein
MQEIIYKPSEFKKDILNDILLEFQKLDPRKDIIVRSEKNSCFPIEILAYVVEVSKHAACLKIIVNKNDYDFLEIYCSSIGVDNPSVLQEDDKKAV